MSMTRANNDRARVFQLAEGARQNCDDSMHEFIAYLVDRCCDLIDWRGYLPDVDEARALRDLAKNPSAGG